MTGFASHHVAALALRRMTSQPSHHFAPQRAVLRVSKTLGMQTSR